VAVSRNEDFYFPVYDSMGNVRQYVDETGAVVAQYSYSPFGDGLVSEGVLAEAFRFRYSTKYLDKNTGLYYFDYRYYNPEIMRWMTPDPSGERGGGNLYAFCNNAPLYSFDPNGLIRIPFITDQAKQAWENVIREVLDRRGWNVAALLMRHSLEPSPSDMEFGEGSIVSSKIKASPEFRQIIDGLIAQQKETYMYYDSSAGISYKTGDLFAGIGHATVYYKGSICKTKKGVRVDLDITVKDKYDFHFLTDYNKASLDGVLATIANNMAWSDQYFDVISVYSWVAKFKERR
jgi:RHS repeat-associated protein